MMKLGAVSKFAIPVLILFTVMLSPTVHAQTAQAWNAFVPTLTAKYTVSSFTPDIAISVSRIQVQVLPALLPLPGCKSNPVVEISNGGATPTVYNLTLVGATNDSGPIAVSYAAGVPITLSVSTASQCLSWATGANIVIQYDTSGLQAQITSLKNQIAAQTAQIAALQAQVSSLTAQDSSVTAQNSALTAQISTLQAQITNDANEIILLTAQVAACP